MAEPAMQRSREEGSLGGLPPLPAPRPGQVLGFYGHREGLKYREFSNFYVTKPYSFRLPDFAARDGWPRTVTCVFSEKAIMLTKAAMMNDRIAFDKLVAATEPSECKALGRSVKGFNNSLWVSHLEETAFEVVRQKFEAHPELLKVLLSTGDATIVESTSKDVIWGIGLDTDDPRIQDPTQWKGQNVLGHALVRVREALKGTGVAASAAASSTAVSISDDDGEGVPCVAAPSAESGQRLFEDLPPLPAPTPGNIVGFYGHVAGRKYREFSNFYVPAKPFDFTLPDFAAKEGWPRMVKCTFSEKAIMLVKAAMMSDRATFEKIVKASTPASAKSLGRSVANFDNALWTTRLEDVAYEVVKQKFLADPGLQKVLLSTGDATIAEATRNDKIWGIGLDVGDPRVQDPGQWQGTNFLGNALMRTRTFLLKSAAIDTAA